MQRMIPTFKAGFGGPIGSGMQAVSFIHADDPIGMILAAAKDESIKGVHNGTAPAPVTMNKMSRELAKALGRQCMFTVPGIVIKLLYGDGAQVVLDGQCVIPNKWIDKGFEFKYPTIGTAVKAVVEEAKT